MHTIIVTLNGGLVQDVDRIPLGVEVEVRDYDVEGADPELHDIREDNLGEYVSSLYGPPDTHQPHVLIIDNDEGPTPAFYPSRKAAERFIAAHRDWVINGPWPIPMFVDRD